jgi:predicted RNase H-like HicB family nuclease
VQNNQHEELQALVKAGSRVLKEEVGMTRQFDVVVEQDSEGFFVATVPALPGCHTQAKSLDELMVRVREAIELCIKDVSPTDEIMDFVGVQRITVNA